MRHTVKNMVLAFALLFSLSLMAQGPKHGESMPEPPQGEEAMPQPGEKGKPDMHHHCMMAAGMQYGDSRFAADSRTHTMAVIDSVDNAVVVLKGKGQELTELFRDTADVFKGRHDVQFIFKPSCVAVYDNYLVYSAVNRDSAMFKVMDIRNAKTVCEQKFVGNITSIAYDRMGARLYLAGYSTTGYTAVELSVAGGFAKIAMDSVSSERSLYKNYSKPKKSDEIKANDPYGLGLTVIAMGTVFLALIIISIIIMGFAKVLMSSQKKKAAKTAGAAPAAVSVEKPAENATSDEYAAIAAAIYMYNEELHDEESGVITIDSSIRANSEWAGKAQNMNSYRR